MNIDLADQEPDVPHPKDRKPCENPDCNPSSDWDVGYGLAGGGMGIYTHCKRCEKIIDKVQDADYEHD